MLYGRRVEIRADPREKPIALVAIAVEHADLDELVRGEVDVDFMQHCRREPVGADAHNGLQMMSPGPKHSPLRRC